MSGNLDKLQVLLKWYKQELGKDLIAAFVLDREGLVVDFIVRPTVKAIEDFVEDIRDLMGLILKKIAEDFTLGSFGAGTFDTIKYRFIFCEAGSQHIFVTILDAMAIAEPVFAYAYLAAEKIARIFDGRPVSPVIPKIYSDDKPMTVQRKVNKLQKLNIPLADYVYKLILGGEGAVGKTSMIQRFVEGVFRTDYKATIGTSITKKECSFEGINNTVRFVIWDLAGQPQFHRIRHNYYTNAEAGLLVFDITRRDTFEMIKKWYFEIKKEASPDIILILVGNKTDLKDSRTVSTAEGEALAKELGITYIETSAITGENINDAFKMLALQLIKQFMEAIEVSEIRSGISPKIDDNSEISEAEITPHNSDITEHRKFSLSDVWKGNEKDFISWIEKNLDLVTESLNISLIPIEHESNDQGTNYVLAEDKFGNKVLVSVQLGQTTTNHFARLISLLEQNDAHKAIWICEKTVFEHEKIIEWFNDNTIDEVALYLVKAEILKVPSASPTLIFQKLLEPKPKAKSTVRYRTRLREIERRRIEFWETLIEKIYKSFPEHANMTPQKSSWIFQPTVKEGVRYAYVIKNDWASIELYFDNPDKELNVKRFKELYKKKEEIDRKFNDISWNLTDELEWDLKEDRSHQSIRYRIDTTGLNGKAVWDDLQIKMIDAMKCLVAATEEIIQSLQI